MNYALHLAILLEISLLLTLSLNLVVGYSGLLSLGHAALFGVGAYVSTIIQLRVGLGWVPSAIIAIMSATLAGLLLSIPAIRLRGDYFVLASLGFQSILYVVLLNWTSVTRGPFGFVNVPRPSFLGLKFESSESMLVLCTAILLLGILYLRVLHTSPFGRSLRAMREDEIAAIALGKNINSLKAYVFGLAGAFAGLAGVLYAGYMRYIDPSSFGVPESLLLLSMVVIGGLGNLKGPAIGTATILLVPEILRFLSIPDALAASLRQCIYGATIIILMRVRPRGIAGEYKLQ
jgi:branched-chain amino acid transport system permease protein